MLVALVFLRFFFSLRITRLFGPFVKLVELSFASLILWTLFTVLFILLMSIYLSVLLSEDQGCDGLKQCGIHLLEAMIGKVRFQLLANNWAANISYGGFSIILGAVLVNMVVAKINANYTSIVKRGSLFYYKELFNSATSTTLILSTDISWHSSIPLTSFSFPLSSASSVLRGRRRTC